MKVQIKILDHRLHEMMPRYATPGSAGVDLRACIDDHLLLAAGAQRRISAGFSIGIPAGHVGIITPRSSTGSAGLVLGNTVGIIDSDYTGEVQITLLNRNDCDSVVIAMERIAQMVIVPVVQAEFEVVAELTTTARGSGGFGSTGK